jgi:release factor glutamine methyltransferase
LDTEILLAHARNCTRIELYTRFDDVVSLEERGLMRALVARRAQAEPVAYLVGHREFFGLEFLVSADVLIPRPDTETLVMELLDTLKHRPSARIVDIGTGSGCIAICAAVHCPDAHVAAIDICPAALKVAMANAEKHAVSDRIEFSNGDLFAPLDNQAPFDVIVSNPPYVRGDELNQLPRDVGQYEPQLALAAGADGLDVIRRLVAQAADRLVTDGRMILEIAPEMSEIVLDLLDQTGHFHSARQINDLSGRPRVISACRATR